MGEGEEKRNERYGEKDGKGGEFHARGVASSSVLGVCVVPIRPSVLHLSLLKI